MSHWCTYGSCITIVLSAYAVNVYPSDCHSSLNLGATNSFLKSFPGIFYVRTYLFAVSVLLHVIDLYLILVQSWKAVPF